MIRSAILALMFCAAAVAASAAVPQSLAWMGEPQDPFRISDEIYYVGARDVTAFLIVTDKGLILTDGAFDATAPQIEANIKKLGFDIKNVKLLMNSHAHVDHAGGLAELKRLSGAVMVASAGDKPVLERGGSEFGAEASFPAVKVDRVLADGEMLKLGHTSLTIHLTPGHTKGCTSWSMTTHVEGKPYQVLFFCSLTVLPQYRLVKNPTYPGIADDYARSIATLKTLPCDIMLASHGGFFAMKEKRAKLEAGDKTAFVDPSSCKTYLANSEKSYRERLAKESAP